MFSASGFARRPGWARRMLGIRQPEPSVPSVDGGPGRGNTRSEPDGAVAIATTGSGDAVSDGAASGAPPREATRATPPGEAGRGAAPGDAGQTAPPGDAEPTGPGSSGLRELLRRPLPPIVPAALALILVQLAIRGWVAGQGYFYWDDLILVSRADRYPLWSPDLLLYDHDGHFMPLAFVTAWVVTKIAPLQWGGPIVTMIVLQLAASLSVLRMLVVLMPARAGRTLRWAVLIPLAAYLFGPLTLPAFSWWAAALNALPLQIAMAWVVADAVLLVRTGRRRYAVTAIVALIVGLLFFEKTVVVPFVAFAVAVLDRYIRARPEQSFGTTLRAVARSGAALWGGAALVLAGWAAVYLSVAEHVALDTSLAGARRLLHSATSLGIVPTLLGGPWGWERWLPSSPFADPPTWLVVVGWLVLAAIVVVTVRWRRRVLPVWIAVVGYVLLVQLPIVLIRGGPNTAAELMQSLRYLADVAVVLAAACALLLSARPRGQRSDAGAPAATTVSGAEQMDAKQIASGAPTEPESRKVPVPRRALGRNQAVGIALTAAFVASSLYTTVTFTRSWQDSPTRTYLTNAAASFDDWDGAPLLEQEVPWGVLMPMTRPQNLISRVLAPVAPDGAFGTSTERLRMFTDEGRLVDASVWWNRRILDGPEAGCGYRINGAQPQTLWLDGPLMARGWTAQLNYFANEDGKITVALEHGAPVVVPVRAGAHTVYVRLDGEGRYLRIGAYTPGSELCVGVGPVGVAAFAH